MKSKLIMIPSRMGSKRFPGKALVDVGGKPMVIRVYEQCVKTGLPVAVKTPDREIADVCYEYGARFIISPEDYCFNGSDACFEGLELMEDEFDIDFEHIINVQGDLPNIDPDLITRCISACQDIGTLLSKDPGDVIATVGGDRITGFERRKGSPQHVGIYCFTRDALDKFYHAARGVNELDTDLEGWRAVEAGLNIGWDWCDAPCPVDYPEDLANVH